VKGNEETSGMRCSKSGREMILDQAGIELMMLKVPKESGIFVGEFNHHQIDSEIERSDAYNWEENPLI
jgi:hypothetical protein